MLQKVNCKEGMINGRKEAKRNGYSVWLQVVCNKN